MGGKKKKQISKHPPIIQNQEDYDLKRNFYKLNRFRSSNDYQTRGDEEVEERYCPPVDSSYSQETEYNTVTNQIGDTYFRLEDKISALSDKNDAAHDSLRKELEGKIEKVKTDFEQHSKDKKEDRKWIIGTAIAIVIAIVGYFVLPYQKANKNQHEIIKIQTTIDENIKPSIEKNSNKIEKNALEIKNNTEKLIQIQNQQNKNSSN